MASPTALVIPTGINPLNGLPMEESFTKSRPLAVMFNNIKVALPQHGLSQADIIYEAMAEGGITRIVGIFKDPSVVPAFGSIRSTRAYYIDIALGHDALLMHAGGSPEALQMIKDNNVVNIDGTTDSKTFYRNQERLNKKISSEHTLFAKGEDVAKKIESLTGKRTQYEDQYNPFSMGFGVTNIAGDAATKLTLKYPGGKTNVYEYEDGVYKVNQYNQPMIDGNTDKQVTVKNVLVLFTDVSLIAGDTSGRLRTRMTGTGDGWAATGGKLVKIKWSKEAIDKPFVYTLQDGKPLTLNAGVSYINIAQTGSNFTFE
ncbi:hypothetical protein FACS1894217_15370 [Clostridia bacterium]|nr:hypothetical protein FACS1894217_15370 [Clostridia bacterium]